MSKHNRERRFLWQAGLTRRQRANKLGLAHYPPQVLHRVTHDEIRAARAAFTPKPRVP